MKRKTTITLTIVGLLALTGIFYAGNPNPFATVNTPKSPLPHPPNQPAANATPFATVLDPSGNGPVGVAASKTDLLVTEWCSGNLGSANVDTIDCFGNVSVLATIPGPPSTCLEKYMAIAPMQAVNAGFTQRDVFVTQGGQIWQIRPPNPVPTLFATIPGCAADHTGITFDHTGPPGTFGNKMIVTCQNGSYWKVDGTGTVTMIANDPSTHPEGPVVAPLSFGVYGGQIWVADENNSQVHAISNTGTVTFGVVGWFAAEGMQVIPPAPCMYCSGGAFFQAIVNFPSGNVYQYPPTDFSGLGGNLLVTSESGAGTAVITPVGGDYVTSFFDNITGGLYEGDSFVDCDVPTPTPTATATATFTPTATATATFTPTATATFTPTPTATATATSTPTPTPSATPIQVSKITPTGTTCTQFKNGTAQTLSSVNYSVSNGVIHNVNPGVFFYWVRVTVPAGSNTLTITQTITTGNFNTFFALASGSNVFDSNCNSVGPTITQNANITTVTFTAPTAGTYFISIKYDPHSVVGMPAPSPGTTVHYDLMTTGVPGSTSGLDLVKQ